MIQYYIYRFIPRHHDELCIEIGDPIYVQKEAEDLWCEGNLKLVTEKQVANFARLYQQQFNSKKTRNLYKIFSCRFA